LRPAAGSRGWTSPGGSLVEYRIRIEEPKSRNGKRTLPLDGEMVAALNAPRRRQSEESTIAGTAYRSLALASSSSPATKPEQGLNDHRQRHDTLWSTVGLLGSELECHDHDLPSQWFQEHT
jgi:hypothetical protein